MSVVSMSKKEFDRLEIWLGVRSGRLRIVDACELLGLKRRQVFRLLAGLKHGAQPAWFRNGAVGRATIVCPRRIVIWLCRWFANDTLISVRRWRGRSWRRSTAAGSPGRRCGGG